MGEHLESEGVAEENCYDELLELVVQGREIVVSEQVLCANSKYFKQVFCDLNPNVDTFILKQHGSEEFCNEIGNGSSTTNGFHDDEDDWWEYEDDEEDENEDEEQEKENVVDPLSLISYATMRAIIDHLSTGEALGICEQNVRHLLTAADLLAIGAVESECLSFLRTRVTTANCVRRFVLADSKPAWAALALYLLRCVQARFTALRTHPQLYQHPDAGQFARILAGESLAVDSEEQESLGSSYCSPFCQAHAATCLRKLDHAVRVCFNPQQHYINSFNICVQQYHYSRTRIRGKPGQPDIFVFMSEFFTYLEKLRAQVYIGFLGVPSQNRIPPLCASLPCGFHWFTRDYHHLTGSGGCS